MTHGSLFSGIGGFDLGFERAGIKTLWQVENDARCCEWLRHNFPGTALLGDIKDCGRHNLPWVDIVSAGVPCQPASTAGKRRGTKDDRWLWPQMCRVVSEVHPTWLVAENPCGLTSLDGGVVFESVLSDLESVGYEVQPLEIPACGVGAPQERFRVFIIAHLDERRRPGRAYLSIQPSPEFSDQQSPTTQPLALRNGAARIASDADPTRRANGQGLSQSSRASRRRQSALDIGRTPQTNHWETEPGVGVLVHGIPNGLAGAVEAFGNSIVPQLAEAIGRMILAVDTHALSRP